MWDLCQGDVYATLSPRIGGEVNERVKKSEELGCGFLCLWGGLVGVKDVVMSGVDGCCWKRMRLNGTGIHVFARWMDAIASARGWDGLVMYVRLAHCLV